MPTDAELIDAVKATYEASVAAAEAYYALLRIPSTEAAIGRAYTAAQQAHLVFVTARTEAQKLPNYRALLGYGNPHE